MNDIEILEEYIKEQKEFAKQFNLEEIEDGTEGQRRLQAIESLIKRNEELEKGMGTDLHVVYLRGVYNERDRWKNKVKQLIQELEYDQLENPKNICEDRIKIEAYRALLQEE